MLCGQENGYIFNKPNNLHGSTKPLKMEVATQDKEEWVGQNSNFSGSFFLDNIHLHVT